jgi:hypothetical protein
VAGTTTGSLDAITLGPTTAAAPIAATAMSPRAAAFTGKDQRGFFAAALASAVGVPAGAGNWPAAIMSAHHESRATCSGLSSARSGDFHSLLGASGAGVSRGAVEAAAWAAGGSANVCAGASGVLAVAVAALPVV